MVSMCNHVNVIPLELLVYEESRCDETLIYNG